MARKQVNVAVRDVDPAQIPEVLVEGAIVLTDLEARGLVDEAEKRLTIRRQGGYPAVDIFVAIFLFLVWKGHEGFKSFWPLARPHQEGLAGAAGRKKLASPSALSRALGAVEVDLLREQAGWLLTEAPDVDGVLRHPSVLTYDAHGDGWHAFDLDPTVRTLRHRALPVDDDYPEAKRRSEEMGVPGYSGRKRGDIQFRRTDVQHAGAGLWVHAHLHRGNGDGVLDFEPALDSIVALLDRLGWPRNRSFVRMDGEHGSVPYFTACRDRHLPFITRLNRQNLLDDPDVLGLMRTATWYQVPDSLCGPTRAAADLGVLTVHPDSKTRRPDGSRYEPISVRVVACIFPRKSKAKRGRLLDGRQVELFAVDLPADAWPAPEAIAAYFGRSGDENRFAQEDREVGLDRILSYHLPGQEFATLVGLFVLNYRTARGFELEPPPAVPPTPVLRRPVVDESIPEGWPTDPIVSKLLDSLDWRSMLRKRPGWRWDAGTLLCPDGREMTFTTVRAAEHAPGRTGIIFRRPLGGCEDCDERDQCLTSDRPQAVKHVEFSVPSDIADQLRARLALVRGKVDPDKPLDLDPIQDTAGLHKVLTPLFLPREARRRLGEVFDHATLRIEVDVPEPDRPQRPRLVAADEADRQKRRQSWEQRAQYNKLPEVAVVRIEAQGRAELATFLRVPRPRRRSASR
jgi:hypothetical protein